MPAAGNLIEAGTGSCFVVSLWQDTSPQRDDCIACQDVAAFDLCRHCLFACHAPRIVARKLTFSGRLVNIGCADLVWRDAEPRKQFAAARAGGREDKPRPARSALLRQGLSWGPDRCGRA